MARKRHFVGLVVFLVIVAFAVVPLVLICGKPKIHTDFDFKILNGNNSGSRVSGKSKGNKFFSFGKGGRYIALLYVEGVITDAGRTYNQNWILDTIDELYEKNNEGILLYLNSPGGGVYESDEVYLALQDYKRETGRPVYAYLGPMAASGGYYIASAADKIFANRNTLTGSIGVIAGESFDATALMEKLGVKSETIHAGKNKNMLNYNEPFTDEQRAIMQSVADECYEQFTEIVASSRKMDIEKVQALADGRIYTAKQAQANGLIDGICSFENAQALLLERLPDKDDVETETFRYEKDSFVTDILFGEFSGKGGRVKFPAYLYEGSLR